MPIVDMPLEQLRAIERAPNKRSDFDAYWERTLAESRATPLREDLTRVDYPVEDLDVFSVRYDGWRGARIAGTFLVPRRRGQPARLPTLVFYHGYGGSKSPVHDYLGWALQGYAILAVDVRGQPGESSNPGPYSGGHVSGWMTQGIASPEEYYYRGAYVDCVRALDLAVSRDEVDPDRVGVTGLSQGGGLTLAVAALDPRPKVAMSDVPFLCDFRRALDVTDRAPYNEIAIYCNRYPDRVEQVFATLSYVDNLNLADRIRCPALITVGLQDLVCPPSTIFAVYNRIDAIKELAIFLYGAHEAFATHHATKLRWATRYLREATT